MGFFSGFKKFVKSVFKGAKKVFKKVTKVIKKVTSSKIFKVVAIGAALYFGGAALGYWKSPVLKSINGKWKESALGSEGSLGKWLGTAADTSKTTSMRYPSTSDPLSLEKPPTIDQTSPQLGNALPKSDAIRGAAPNGYAPTPEPMQIPIERVTDNDVSGAFEKVQPKQGLLEGAVSKVGDWVGGAFQAAKDNPMATSIGLQAIQGLTATPVETTYEATKGKLLAEQEYKEPFEVGDTPEWEAGAIYRGMYNKGNTPNDGVLARAMAADGTPSARVMSKSGLAQVQAPITRAEAFRQAEEAKLQAQVKATRSAFV